MEVKVYLANDLGFNEAGRYWLDNVCIPAIEEVFAKNKIDAVIYEPFRDNAGEGREGLAADNEKHLFESNLFMGISEGQSFDTGVATEIGMSYARNAYRRIYVMRSDSRRTNDHPKSSMNLQTQSCVEKSGGTISKSLKDLIVSLDHYLYLLKEF